MLREARRHVDDAIEVTIENAHREPPAEATDVPTIVVAPVPAPVPISAPQPTDAAAVTPADPALPEPLGEPLEYGPFEKPAATDTSASTFALAPSCSPGLRARAADPASAGARPRHREPDTPRAARPENNSCLSDAFEARNETRSGR